MTDIKFKNLIELHIKKELEKILETIQEKSTVPKIAN